MESDSEIGTNKLKRVAAESEDNRSELDLKAKKKKVLQRYRLEYTQEWPCIIKSKKSEYYASCTVCSSDFLIQYGGRDDVRRHVTSKKHVDNGEMRKYKPISNFFTGNDENSVIKAEMLFTCFIIEHNVPIASTDHTAGLFRAMFPDSKIAKKYSCARTKTSAIIKDMAKYTQSEIVSYLKNNPFCLATDGSTDTENNKLYPILVSFFNNTAGKIDTVLLSIKQTSDNTGEGIYNLINEELNNKDIPWDNCISFSSDNANTMIGQFKGVVAFLLKVQPSIINIGCCCHLLNLAAKKATAELKLFNVEEFLIHVYYYLDKSSKRKNELKLCQEICGLKPHKIFKYVSTRWLSLLDSINRVLEQWDALYEYFCNQNDNNDINSRLQNPLSKLYFLFLSNVLPIFTSVNQSLQQESPAVHLLQRKLVAFFTDLIIRFVKPTALSNDSTSVLDIKFNKRKHQKDDNELVIGADTRSYLTEAQLTDEQLDQFYAEVRNFFCAACNYVLKKFPVKNEILKHAKVADVSLRRTASYESIEFFIKKFPTLLNKDEIERIEAEFASYQFENFAELSYDRMDDCWHQISQVTNVSDQKKYIVLPKLMKAILLIPHSNAAIERVFSIIRKNHTEFRSSLNIETLNALMIEKLKSYCTRENCYQKTFSKQQYVSAKKCTTMSTLSVQSSEN